MSYLVDILIVDFEVKTSKSAMIIRGAVLQVFVNLDSFHAFYFVLGEKLFNLNNKVRAYK